MPSLEGGSRHLEIHDETASDRLKPGLHTLCPSFACEICGLEGPPGLQAAKPDSRRAFSLIELIGVLAVIAILAAIAVPTVIKRIDRAAWLKESAGLRAMSDAYVQYVLQSYSIPDETFWTNAVSANLGL